MKINKKGMGSVGNALIIVLSINLMLWFGQMAVLEINPSGTNFFDKEGSLINEQNSGNYTLNSNSLSQLPSGESSVSVTTGNVFTDIFTTAKNWILESTGLSYILNILSAPMSFLKAIGLPQAFAYGVAAMWYGITLFLLASFFLWGDK